MASANITLDNAKFYNVVKFDIKTGGTFQVDILDDPGSLRWFSDNDPVLDIKVDGMSAVIDAKTVGESEIQLRNASGALVMTLFVNVVAAVEPQATSLNPTASKPVPKNQSTKT